MLTGGASASSFVTLPARDPATSPSIVYMGTPPQVAAAAAEPVKPGGMQFGAALVYPSRPPAELASAPRPPVTSPSIIALGEPVIAVEDFRVAAIPNPPARQVEAPLPTVMRGGLLGEAFSRNEMPSVGPAAPSAPAPGPSSDQASSPPPRPSGPPSRRGPPPPTQPVAPPAPEPPPQRFDAPR